MRAIVLLNVTSGIETTILEKLKDLPGIIDCFVTFGEYDISILLKASGAKQLGQLITQQIRKIDGVQKTLTLIEAVTENNDY